MGPTEGVREGVNVFDLANGRVTRLIDRADRDRALADLGPEE
jgi:hypothetical protein